MNMQGKHKVLHSLKNPVPDNNPEKITSIFVVQVLFLEMYCSKTKGFILRQVIDAK